MLLEYKNAGHGWGKDGRGNPEKERQLVTVVVLLFYGKTVLSGAEIYGRTICLSVLTVSMGVIAGRFLGQIQDT